MMIIDEEADFIETESFTLSKDSEFHEKDLPDGRYGFMSIMTDRQNHCHYSDMVDILIEDGYVDIAG